MYHDIHEWKKQQRTEKEIKEWERQGYLWVLLFISLGALPIWVACLTR